MQKIFCCGLLDDKISIWSGFINQMPRQIGLQNESTLHAALKDWYAQPGDLLEVEVDGYVVDIVREQELFEIQTGNFVKIKKKLNRLLENHFIHLVYPLSTSRWVLRVDNLSGEIISRRRSPKKGRMLDIFHELVFITDFILNPNLSFDVLSIEDEIVYINDGLGSWRRKGWSILDRRLVKIIDSIRFENSDDFKLLLPDNLPTQFTPRDLAVVCGLRIRLAQKIAYSLCQMGILERVGKQGRSWLYRYKQV